MGDEVATMLAAADGIPRAHVILPPMEGVPPHISSYLRVADVDAGLAAAIENGGSMVVPPTDIPPGRFAGVASPSGAVFLLFHEADEASAENPGASNGAIHWVELHSTDLATDVAWMESSFGIGHQKMQGVLGSIPRRDSQGQRSFAPPPLAPSGLLRFAFGRGSKGQRQLRFAPPWRW